MTRRTAVTDAEYVIAFDGTEHRILPEGTVVYEDDTIVYVGPHYDGPVDQTICAQGHVLIPGLINVHSHLLSESLNKGYLEDVGSRKLGMSGLFEYLVAGSAPRSEEESSWVLRYALTELLKSGCTTVLQIGQDTDDMIDVYGEMGIRAYVARPYRDAHWYTNNGHELLYEWDVKRGRESFREAVDFVERHSGRYNDRIRSFLAPGQVDTCTPELLKETVAAQQALGVPVQIHVSQSIPEWNEMMRRHGMTPVEWLGDQDFLGPDTILAHCVFLNHHSLIQYRDHDDLALLGSTGAAVAHAPWVFARRGFHMQSLGRYLREGINVGIGTDTVPQDMLEEVRWAAVMGKNAEADTGCPTAAEVFDAATLGGARAVGRDDLGRIAAGARADMVLIDADTMAMRPLRDPVKNIVYSATSRSVSTVIADGRVVVDRGRVLGVSESEIVTRVQALAEKVWAGVKDHDWAGRTVDEMSPMSYRLWE